MRFLRGCWQWGTSRTFVLYHLRASTWYAAFTQHLNPVSNDFLLSRCCKAFTQTAHLCIFAKTKTCACDWFLHSYTYFCFCVAFTSFVFFVPLPVSFHEIDFSWFYYRHITLSFLAASYEFYRIRRQTPNKLQKSNRGVCRRCFRYNITLSFLTGGLLGFFWGVFWGFFPKLALVLLVVIFYTLTEHRVWAITSVWEYTKRFVVSLHTAYRAVNIIPASVTRFWFILMLYFSDFWD